MIALDTNVLVRLLSNDNPAQVARALRVLELARKSGEPILVNDVVLAETLWTMSRTFKVRKNELIDMAQALFDMPLLTFESRDTVFRALDLFGMSTADFADCLIVAKNHALGARVTLSFDEAFDNLPQTQVL